MAYSSIRKTALKKAQCKHKGCTFYPAIGLNGFCSEHADAELKTEIVTKRQQQNRNRAKRSNLKRKAHLIQREVGKPQFALKRQNKPIAKAGKKRLTELKKYTPLKKQFLKEHPLCECGLPDCDKKESVDVHHTYMGKDRGKYFLVVETWKAVSRRDHRRIHDVFSTEQLIEFGLRKLDIL